MSLKTFIPVEESSHFPIQNLPYGIFSTSDDPHPRAGTRIGDWVLDLGRVERAGLLGPATGEHSIFNGPDLNRFMGLGRAAWREIRGQLTGLLRIDNPAIRGEAERRVFFRHVDEARMHLPATIGDFTDFYASRAHAENAGAMFRGRENALMPNWLHLPAGYNGRASSVILSGKDVRRPRGQVLHKGEDSPVLIPTKELDFELEVGVFIGPGNPLGAPIPVEEAADHLFGMVLLNDWSARDIQRWEYRPLGPFLAKDFATSISPWIVTMDALEPFRTPGSPQKPQPLPYLARPERASYDVHLEVALQTSGMETPSTISRSNMTNLYWSVFQMVAHHSITGCNLRPGDLIGTGTISGAARGSEGSMLELAWRGERPLALPGGERRTFIEDGDRVVMTGFGQGDGYRVGFGELNTRILPAGT